MFIIQCFIDDTVLGGDGLAEPSLRGQKFVRLASGSVLEQDVDSFLVKEVSVHAQDI